MVDEILGVVKLVPVPRLDPPDAAAYQLIVPAEAVAPKVTVPVPQILPGVVPVIVGIGLTVVEIVLLVAGLPVAQGVEFDVKTTYTILPLVSVVVVKVLLAPGAPTFNPLTRHWYNGEVPPLIGAAVKVTEVPAQMTLSASFETILTLTGKLSVTVVVMALLVAGLPIAQVTVELMTTVTAWPVVRLVVV